MYGAIAGSGVSVLVAFLISTLITDAVELAGHGDRVSAAQKLHEAVFLIVG